MIEIIKVESTQAHLVYELFNQYRIFYKQQHDIDLAKKFIDARLNNNESVIFVALNNNNSKPVGFTQLYPNYSSVRAIKNWTLNDLYVDKDYRKQGVGEKLIKKAMEYAKNEHAKFVELSTAVDNYSAQSVYEKIGFKRQDPDNEFYTYRIDLS